MELDVKMDSVMVETRLELLTTVMDESLDEDDVAGGDDKLLVVEKTLPMMVNVERP